MVPGAGPRSPPAEAGHIRGASDASSLAGTECDVDITLDSWKNNLKVPLAGLPQDLP